jgi:serine/threonine-protein kinase
MREARAAARIKSEHVAKVSDVGTLPDNTPYIVMEYLEGADLADTLAQRGPFSADEAIELVLQACEALAEAHSLGIVHRDLKPANLFLTHRADGTPSVKVLDFGISKVTQGTSQAEAALTHTTTIMGSPLYMSPEQIRATRTVDLRSDIWSLGVILYELLAGEAPFLGTTLPDISVKIAVEPPPPLRAKRPDLSGILEAVILKCLEKDRENRFRTLGDFSLALLDLAPPRARVSIDRVIGVINTVGLPESVLPSGVAPSGKRVDTGSSTGKRVITGESSADTVSTFGTTNRAGASKKPLFIAAGIAAVVLVGGAAVVLLPSGRHGDPTTAATAPPPADVPAKAPEPSPPAPAVAPAPVVEPAPVATAEPAAPPPEPSSAPAKAGRPRVQKTSKVSAPAATPTPAPAPAPTPQAPTNILDSRK